MSDFDLPDDLKDDVEVIYLQEDEEIEEYDEDMGEMESEGPTEPVVDLAKVTFKKHEGPIFCCALSKDNKVAVTGGKDDLAYVWDVATGNLLYECTGHKDSVTVVEFSHDEQLIVTADMGGLIQVWSVKDKNLLWCNEGDDMLFLFWHSTENIIITGTKSGEVYIWQVPQGNCKVFPSPGAGATCGKLLNDGKKVLVGYEDGMLKLWDIKSTSVVWQLEDRLSNEVITIDLNENNSLVAVGPTGECFKVSDGRLVNYFLDPEKSDIEALTFSTELNALVTGTLNGNIFVWDLGKAAIRHQIDLKSFVISLKWGKNGKLYAGCLDGNVYICDIRSGAVCEVLTGHESEILSMTVASDSSFILTTSEDKTAKIFTLKND